MSVILQAISIDVEKINRTGYASIEPDESPEKSSGGSTAGSISPHRKSADSTLDQDYVRSMEESYGINEEGVF
jgi:hypothetical protein